MDNNNSAMDTVDWRTNLQLDSRQRIVNKIVDTLKKHLPFSGEEGLNEIMRITERFEEKIFSAATSQSDYLRKISLKMLTMETKSQNTVTNSMPNNQAGTSNPSLGSLGSNNQVQPLLMPLKPQNTQNPIGVENIASSSSSSGLVQIQNSMPNLIPQTPNVGSNLQNPKRNLMIGQGFVANNNFYFQQQQQLLQNSHLLQQQNLLQQRSTVLLQQAEPSVRAADQNSISFLEAPKSSIEPGYKEKVVSYEKQIVNFVNTNKRRKTIPQMQPQQPQQSQPLENQEMDPQMQSMSSQGGPMPPMQQSNMSNLQQNSAPPQQQQQQHRNMMAAQPQPQQQQTMSQMHPQQQQQLGLQQQQRDMAQRLQTSAQNPGSLIQAQNVMDQQKQQLYQAQGGVPPDTSSTSLDSTAQTGHLNGGDWQEEVYQKLKHMKEQYLPELSEMHRKIVNKLMQHDSLPQQPKSEQFEKLKLFKAMLERCMTFLQVPKSSIQPGYKEKMVSYEKQIINFVNVNNPRKTTPQMQQQPQQYQITQVQPLASVNGADRQDEVYRKDLWIRQ